MGSRQSDKVLHREKVDKGISLAVFDRSRKVAGDRWLVKIVCILSIEAEALGRWQAEKGLGGEEGQTYSPTEEEILLKTFGRERHFVDQKERKGVREELLEQLKTTLFPYLRKASFADRLLAESQAGLRQMMASEDGENPYAHLDEEDGPADFSSLFG